MAVDAGRDAMVAQEGRNLGNLEVAGMRGERVHDIISKRSLLSATAAKIPTKRCDRPAPLVAPDWQAEDRSHVVWFYRGPELS